MAYAGIVVFDIPNITINISPNLSMFFVGLLLLILAGIFTRQLSPGRSGRNPLEGRYANYHETGSGAGRPQDGAQ